MELNVKVAISLAAAPGFAISSGLLVHMGFAVEFPVKSSDLELPVVP